MELNKVEASVDDQIKMLESFLLEPDQAIDISYVENNVLAPKNQLSRQILTYHCKMKAIEDLLFALHEKEMPLQDMLKLIRRLSKKQFKL